MTFLALCLVFFDCLLATSLVNALSSPTPEIIPRQFIQLTNPVGAEQSLPASFVRDWPTWVLDEDGTLSKIPDEDGFVQPASIDELWQPVDLKRPDLRLALGLHVREGTIRHVMPSVDLSFNGGLNRNRGMCSVPRAHAWIDFTNSLDEWDNYQIVLAKKKTGDDSWTQISTSSSSLISGAIERGMFCLADAPDELGESSHIINVLLGSAGEEMGVVECPNAGHEIRVTMDDDEYIATGSPEAAPGVLQVAITASMAGSQSEYLPEVYKELFNDESLRNPLYAKFKERQSERKQNK